MAMGKMEQDLDFVFLCPECGKLSLFCGCGAIGHVLVFMPRSFLKQLEKLDDALRPLITVLAMRQGITHIERPFQTLRSISPFQRLSKLPKDLKERLKKCIDTWEVFIALGGSSFSILSKTNGELLPVFSVDSAYQVKEKTALVMHVPEVIYDEEVRKFLEGLSREKFIKALELKPIKTLHGMIEEEAPIFLELPEETWGTIPGWIGGSTPGFMIEPSIVGGFTARGYAEIVWLNPDLGPLIRAVWGALVTQGSALVLEIEGLKEAAKALSDVKPPWEVEKTVAIIPGREPKVKMERGWSPNAVLEAS